MAYRLIPSHFEHCFSVENGVKQGGIVSPVLFCLYIDELLYVNQKLYLFGVSLYNSKREKASVVHIMY